MSEELPKEILNILEMVVRCYDCCLSCSAHITVIKKENGEEVFNRPLNVGLGLINNEKEELKG